MKLVLAALLLSLSTGAFALSACGTHASEKKFADHAWQKAMMVNVDNSFQPTEGIICAGMTATNKNSLSRIVYRDNNNRVVEADLNQLKAGIILVSDKDLPPEASLILRSGNYVAIKLTETKATTTDTIYTLSIRIVRNLSTGFFSNSAPDYRVLNFSGIVNFASSKMYTSIENTKFDEVELNLSTLPVNFEEIYFYDRDVNVKKMHAKNLPKIPALL